MNECSVQEKGDHSGILVRCIQLDMSAWDRKLLVTSILLHFFVYKDTNLSVIQFNDSLSWICKSFMNFKVKDKEKTRKDPSVL